MTHGVKFAQPNLPRLSIASDAGSLEGDGAPKDANLSSVSVSEDRAGASRRAIRGVLFGIGPRFSPVRRASKAPTEPSASSWQGLLVVPGGAPMPPGRLTCVAKVRGRRTSSRVRKRLATAPLQKDEVGAV